MPAKIDFLPEDVINQIAAGEVIERPASAVKELVENALDAGADFIRIQTIQGGKNRIRVQDNGAGMEAADLDLCYLRHTTSKLRTADEIFRLATNGFRGEAIASIASIAQLTIDSRPAHCDVGARIRIEGGMVVERSQEALPVGTTFQVDNLFFNTPVRANFLGSDSLENSRILDVVLRIAIAHPEVRWEFRSGDKEAFTGAPGDLRSRLAEALGSAMARRLVAVEHCENGIRVHGFTSTPDETRGKRSHQFIYLQKRPIWNSMVSRAIQRAYEPYGKGGFPVSVLFLEMQPGEFDVNVHPAKREVRFSNESLVFAAVHHAIRAALMGGSTVDNATQSAESDSGSADFPPPIFSATPSFSFSGTGLPSPGLSSLPAMERDAQRPVDTAAFPGFSQFPVSRKRSDSSDVVQDLFSQPEFGKVVPLSPSMLQVAQPTSPVRTPAPIFMQFAKTYVVCEDSQGLLLIDQNAAHQRILFEQALTSLEHQEQQAAQELLFPELVELDRVTAALLETHSDLLGKLGFHVEPFGGANWQLRSIPLHLPLSRAVQALHSFLDDLRDHPAPADGLREAMARAYAMGSAIPAGQDLSVEEMAALMDQLLGCTEPYSSPSGRPTLLRLPTPELDKRFKR